MEKPSAQPGLRDQALRRFIGVGLVFAQLAPVSASATPVLTETFTYDALGRRTSETRTDAIANRTTYYYYDGERIIAEYDAADTLEQDRSSTSTSPRSRC
jgi:hypothetical protein